MFERLKGVLTTLNGRSTTVLRLPTFVFVFGTLCNVVFHIFRGIKSTVLKFEKMYPVCSTSGCLIHVMPEVR